MRQKVYVTSKSICIHLSFLSGGPQRASTWLATMEPRASFPLTCDRLISLNSLNLFSSRDRSKDPIQNHNFVFFSSTTLLKERSQTFRFLNNPMVKYSGGKTAPSSGLWVDATTLNSRTRRGKYKVYLKFKYKDVRNSCRGCTQVQNRCTCRINKKSNGELVKIFE